MSIHPTAFIHPTAVVEFGAKIGARSEILQYAVVRAGACVGEGVRVCSHVYVDAGVVIGDRCKVKNGALLYDGVVLEEDVFIGPGVVFTNDPWPRADQIGPRPFPRTCVQCGATIGANATILPGVTVWDGAMVGAGAVVTHSVDPNTVVVGNPARLHPRS